MMDLSLRRQLVLALAASLTACGGGAGVSTLSGNKVIDSSNSPQPPAPAPTPTPAPPAPAPAPPAMPGDPVVSQFPASASGVTPALEGGSIAHAGDGTLWFSGGFVPNQIGRMTTGGAVSYPVTRAADLVSFNPGPLTRGPDGNVWFADPQAGIELAGTIGSIDIATKIASEIATPLLHSTFQISRRTSQDQSCETATGVCTPVPVGSCVVKPPTPYIPAIPPIPPIPPSPGNPAGTPGVPGVPGVPAVPAYAGSTCRTVTTGPTLVAACAPVAPTLASDYMTTTCNTVSTGPDPVAKCELDPPVAGNQFIRTVCTGITPGSQAYVTTTGPDGNVWFTEYNGTHVGRFDVVTRLATEFGPLKSPATTIAAGPDGNLWFAERSIDGASTLLGRITPLGVITEFNATPVPGFVRAMTAGADGHVWFVKDGFGGPAVGKVDTATGAFTSYSAGLAGAFTLFGGIALGGDGNVWFTQYYDGLIGRITPSGTISEFGGIAPNPQLNAITAGPQLGGLGTLWVTDPTGKSIAKVTLH